MAFVAGGKVLLARIGDDDRWNIKGWDVATGKLVHKFAISERMSRGVVAFSPDGRLAALTNCPLPFPSDGREAELWLWDVAAGQPIRQLHGRGQDAPRTLAFSPDGRTLTSGHLGTDVRLWEIATGKERCVFRGHRQSLVSLAYSADAKLLASTAHDNSALIWDLTGRLTYGEPGSRILSADEMQSLWRDLRAADAAVAYRAMCRLISGRQTVSFLKAKLSPVAALDKRQHEQLLRLVADLDNEEFTARVKAEAELARWGFLAETGLRQTLRGRPSVEQRRRIELLLKKLSGPPVWEAARAVEILERIATAEAVRALEAVAGGASDALPTREARAAKERLTRRN